jgi:hypothetical protein
MAADEPLDPDDPAVIAAAVRILAAEGHAVLTRAAAGGPGNHREAIDELLRRIGALQARLGEGRLHHLRLWLDGLQRQAMVLQQQAIIVQDLGELRGRVERLEGQDGAPSG